MATALMRGLQWSPAAILALLRWSSDSKRLNLKQFSIVVQTGNYSGEIIREAIFLGEISWEGDKCASGGSYCSEGDCSGTIVRGKNLGDYCPGSNFMGGNCLG